ncbi:MAG: hydroxyacylglutathione hydrolase [Alphaproteobacteria bacterium]|nr:hydroxyacylglutathione hydrolase [Alphaproteobacteria bacterium]
MIVEQVWTGNSGRNFFYIVACPGSGEAIAIDPIDSALCLSTAKDKGWDITWVMNTHEHADHIEGNDDVIAATGAKLMGPHNAGCSIPGIDKGLRGGDVVKLGTAIELEVIDTPGHTPIHISMLGHGDEAHLLCGDTIFNAGVGHCYSGDPNVLYATFRDEIAKMADNTRIYPGHDYIGNNLKFTLDREPDNADAKALLADVEGQDPANALVTTLGMERKVNTFMRLDNASVVAGVKAKFPDLPDTPSDEDVFLSLRKLRNDW